MSPTNPELKTQLASARVDRDTERRRFEDLAAICAAATPTGTALEEMIAKAREEGAAWKQRYDDGVAAIVKALQEQHPPPPTMKPIVGVGLNGHGEDRYITADMALNALDLVPFKHGRFDCTPSDSAETLASLADKCLARGVMPLINPVGVAGMSEQQAYDWIAARAPALKGKCSAIEWGNEDYFGGNMGASYARSALGACRAGAERGVKVLVQAGGAYHTEVVPAIVKATPSIGDVAGGWTMHPYWPDYTSVIPAVQEQIKGTAHPDIWVTEMGFSSFDGRGPLAPDNYGWDTKLTYAGAGKNLLDFWAFAKTRIFALYLFQLVDQRAPGTSVDREGGFGTTTWPGGAWASTKVIDKGAYTDAVRRVIAEGF